MNDKPYPDISKDSEEVLSRLTSTDPEHVEFSIDCARASFRHQLDRNTEVERKAALLVGATGVAVVLFTALAGFLLNLPECSPGWTQSVLIVLFVLFIALALTFFGTIYFALTVLWVGIMAYPGVLTLLEGQVLNNVEYKKRHVTELFVACSNNMDTTNGKVDQLVWSLRCFRAFLAALLLTGILIAFIPLLQS